MNIYKVERIVRETFLFTCAIALFPFITIRILVWKWHFWIRKNERKITADHDWYQGIK